MTDLWRDLVECAKKGGSTEDELARKIERGHTVIWKTDDGCLALDKATDGACVAWLGVGKGAMRQLVAQEPSIAEWALRQGCNTLRIEGRKGWLRMFPHWEFVGWVDGVARLERKL